MLERAFMFRSTLIYWFTYVVFTFRSGSDQLYRLLRNPHIKSAEHTRLSMKKTTQQEILLFDWMFNMDNTKPVNAKQKLKTMRIT